MKKKELLINIIMTLIMSVFMGLLASVFVFLSPKTETPSLPILMLSNVAESIVVGLIVALIIPFGVIGKKICDKAGVRPPSFKFTALNSIPYSLGNALIISSVVSFINVYMAHSKIPKQVAPPLLTMWLSSWAPLLVPSIILGYLISILVSPYIVKMVGVPKNRE